ncbi:hypothetical protein DASC09_004600 [Saccharomycopsis crataegensis]|uniref:Uncharacterized protein n=1 Tax=Saccharomycopsis crataegensis TaxID=43959 RepID=A0AAV5QF95_9ASCO|nr:hypothetical protein DASC09_004600 [Saccharomycopsis crataegensis]
MNPELIHHPSFQSTPLTLRKKLAKSPVLSLMVILKLTQENPFHSSMTKISAPESSRNASTASHVVPVNTLVLTARLHLVPFARNYPIGQKIVISKSNKEHQL